MDYSFYRKDCVQVLAGYRNMKEIGNEFCAAFDDVAISTEMLQTMCA